ncbi:MAG TPA: SCO family protein [Thermoanaerobaculia bacterium]|nr:SCO family protein [Thermoanaerobaculia bacterium]
MRRLRSLSALTWPAVLFLASAASASPNGSVVPSSEMPGVLKAVGYDQRIGERVPLDSPWKDETGRAVTLRSYFGTAQSRPAVLVLAYYHCPMLCDMVLQGVETGLKPLSLDPGRDFDVVVAGIDPAETPALAAKKKNEILERYARPGTEGGWHFLTGPQDSVTRLAQAVGFRYVYDPQRNQFAHAAGMVILTPEGRVSRYLLGVEYPARDIRLGLVESGNGKLGTVADQILLYCFHYDPLVGRYSAVTLSVVRAAAAATVLILVLLVVFLRRRETAEPGPLGAA